MIHRNDNKCSPEYRAYLQSEKWQKIRERVMLRDCRCVVCGAESNLHVHHIRGAHRFAEENHLEDLCVICEICHDKLHRYWNYCDYLKEYYASKTHEENLKRGNY